MFEDEDNEAQNFEDTLRSIAREVGRSVERAFDRLDLEEAADSIGIDPDVARDWVSSASGWLRAQAQQAGEEMASRVRGAAGQAVDPLGAAAPHPLDLPSEDQGLALAALESGRWTIEPGSDALLAAGEGPAPRQRLGLVRELRVRDWIAADGELTLVGRHALTRWLAASTAH